MIDDDLRALERLAEVNGDAASRLAYVRALERAGQQDRATEALMEGRRLPELREAISRLPSWRHVESDPGNTNFIDLRPLETEPRLQWVSSPEPADFKRSGDVLLASPLGVVSGFTCSRPGVCMLEARTRILDADDGRLRREERAHAVGLVGGTVRVAAPEPRGFELWTAEASSGAPLEAESPSSAWLRSAVSSGSVTFGEQIVSWGDGKVVASSRGRPSPSWHVVGKNPRLDRNGVVLSAIDGSSIFLVNTDGSRAWTVPFSTTHALSPDLVCARDHSGVVVLCRSDGTALGRLDDPPWFPTSPAIVVRDAVFMAEWVAEENRALFRVSAFRPTGEVLWRFRLERDCASQVVRLAGAHGCLYCLAQDGSVLCLETKSAVRSGDGA